MGSPLVAKNCKVAVGATQVNGIGSFTIGGPTTEEVDSTQFGDDWRDFETTLKDGGDFSFDGWFDKDDTNGQVALRSAQETDLGLTDLRFYINASSYYAPNRTGDPVSICKIKSFSVNAEMAGLVNITFGGKVYGKFTLV